MHREDSEKNKTSEPVILETARKAWQDFFSEIKKRCLDRNFGTLSKSEFDLMLFHYYLVNKQEEVGSRYVSDYDIGRDLGLTIQRVRSLREREALKWGLKDDWKKSFKKCLERARYQSKDKVITIPIPDVNVIKEVRNLLESRWLFDDYHSNPKVFQCRCEVLVAICLNLVDESNDEFCKSILDVLSKGDDKDIVRVIREMKHPVWTGASKVAIKTALNALKSFLSVYPVLGDACGGLIDALSDNMK